MMKSLLISNDLQRHWLVGLVVKTLRGEGGGRKGGGRDRGREGRERGEGGREEGRKM